MCFILVWVLGGVFCGGGGLVGLLFVYLFGEAFCILYFLCLPIATSGKLRNPLTRKINKIKTTVQVLCVHRGLHNEKAIVNRGRKWLGTKLT